MPFDDNTKIEGVFQAVKAKFKVAGARELFATVTRICGFRNTRVAGGDRPEGSRATSPRVDTGVKGIGRSCTPRELTGDRPSTYVGEHWIDWINGGLVNATRYMASRLGSRLDAISHSPSGEQPWLNKKGPANWPPEGTISSHVVWSLNGGAEHVTRSGMGSHRLLASRSAA